MARHLSSLEDILLRGVLNIMNIGMGGYGHKTDMLAQHQRLSGGVGKSGVWKEGFELSQNLIGKNCDVKVEFLESLR